MSLREAWGWVRKTRNDSLRLPSYKTRLGWHQELTIGEKRGVSLVQVEGMQIFLARVHLQYLFMYERLLDGTNVIPSGPGQGTVVDATSSCG